MAQACPSGRSHLTEVFRSRESKLFFSAGFPAMCVQTQPVCWRRACPSCRAGLLLIDRVFSFAREMFFSAGFLAMCVQTQPVCWRRLAPQAGAGPSFLDEKKGSKDSPKGRVSILSPLELPLNDQRRCLWKPGEAPALVLTHAQARPAREAGAWRKP